MQFKKDLIVALKIYKLIIITIMKLLIHLRKINYIDNININKFELL